VRSVQLELHLGENENITYTSDMTMADNVWVVVFFAGIAALLYARIRLSKTKRIFITDYQRGIRYKGGAFAGLLKPGSYNSYTPKEQIMVVDMRPQPFVVERLLYQDALQAPSVISIGAELIVSSPYEACSALKNQVDDSIAIVRDALRATVSKSITDTTMAARSIMSREIEAAANVELNRFGMRVSKLEITEVWSRLIQPWPVYALSAAMGVFSTVIPVFALAAAIGTDILRLLRAAGPEDRHAAADSQSSQGFGHALV